MISEETRKKWRSKIEAVIEARESGMVTLNIWESDFIDSIEHIIDVVGNDLSLKQSLKLNDIYARIG